ncbi:MAG: aspartyl/glutamyl-tRNA amidotransferase subunit C [Patescibacteria group bacterium]|nr:aspartyl/glutamyl-tRNA amidotransferase subunit C [Patescibacteria group bacterium]MDE1944191.1 aspartyl/glutamyl-tRNA amidotransferase subunit C [Patescibacteria group bacterium]MDE1945308.1 aspartyl/glutamyl-tRNA amidotransferase subunit C [Patescibacteria group bacterium]MDE2057582.1 aspartyl/glutamyl-tRNA amidotransferase subunit C [Patescibacteria group bacterium]
MATAEEVKKLAALARIEVGEDELAAFTKEFDAILAYVGQLEALELPEAGETPPLRNVMRQDADPYEAGAYTERIAAQFPAREGDALLVKKVISHE